MSHFGRCLEPFPQIAWIAPLTLAFFMPLSLAAGDAQPAPSEENLAPAEWSLKPIRDEAPPRVESEFRSWARNAVDAFIAHRLTANGLTPGPAAPPRIVARRLYFDLIGLPPSPAEMDAFLLDPSEAAYERLVDRLLNSPRYGERWAATLPIRSDAGDWRSG